MTILSCLTITDLSRISSLSKEFYRLVQKRFCSTKTLSFSRKRYWEDWRILNMIGRFPNVSKISLSRCPEFKSLQLLRIQIRSPPLKELDVSFCEQIDDDLFRLCFTLFQRVDTLILSGTLLSDESMLMLARSGMNKTLCLSKCKHITDTGVSLLFEHSQTLRHLDLTSTLISQKAFETLCLSKLTTLNVSTCKRLTQISLESPTMLSLRCTSSTSIVRLELKLPALQDLNLSSCKNLQVLQLRNPKSLLNLNLSGCRALRSLIGPFPLLRQANLYNCHGIQIESLDALVRAASVSLEELNFCGLPQVNDEIAKFILLHCPALSQVSVDGCKNISKSIAMRFLRTM